MTLVKLRRKMGLRALKGKGYTLTGKGKKRGRRVRRRGEVIIFG
jgi:hypothetical protein